MTNRYTKINDYYIKDTKTGEKLSQNKVIIRLNHQDRIIHMKTKLIENLVKTLKKVESKLK